MSVLSSSGNLGEKRFDIIEKVLMIFKANTYAQDEIICVPPPHRAVGLDRHGRNETARSAPGCPYRKCLEHMREGETRSDGPLLKTTPKTPDAPRKSLFQIEWPGSVGNAGWITRSTISAACILSINCRAP